MRKLFAVMVASVFGLGIGSQARADSILFQVVSGNPAAVGTGPDALVVNMVYDITTAGLTSAVTFADIIGGSFAEVTAAVTTGQNGGGSFSILSGFDLTSGGAGVGANCVNAGGATGTRTCTGPPNGDGAGGFGGLSFGGFAVGQYVVGTMTIEATGIGGGSLQSRIVSGGGEWQVFGNDLIPQPGVASLEINVIPEPTTAALLGLGLAGLVIVGRRGRA